MTTSNRLSFKLNPQCLSGVALWSITRMKQKKNLKLKWKSKKSDLKKQVFHFNSVCSVCSHERYLWNTGTDIQPLKFPEAWILLWNRLLDSFLFDLASYRLWYFPLRVNYILKIVFVLCFFLLLHISVCSYHHQLHKMTSCASKVLHSTFWLCFVFTSPTAYPCYFPPDMA